jgi:hypothetical protein
MALKRAAMHCFPATLKGRKKQIRLYLASKRRGLHVRQVEWKGLACVAARRRKRRRKS